MCKNSIYHEESSASLHTSQALRQTFICRVDHELIGTNWTRCCILIPGMLVCRCPLGCFPACPLFAIVFLDMNSVNSWELPFPSIHHCFWRSLSQSFSRRVPRANVQATHRLSHVYKAVCSVISAFPAVLSAKVVNWLETSNCLDTINVCIWSNWE